MPTVVGARLVVDENYALVFYRRECDRITTMSFMPEDTLILMTWHDEAKSEDKREWELLFEALRAFEIRARDAGIPIVFHGTARDGHEALLDDAPRSWISLANEQGTGISLSAQGLYFGTASAAAARATMFPYREPVLIAAFCHDLKRIGELLDDPMVLTCGRVSDAGVWQDVPDAQMTSGPVGWETSLHERGAICLRTSEPLKGADAMVITLNDWRDVLARMETRLEASCWADHSAPGW